MQPRDWLRTRQNWFFRLHFLVDEGRKVEKSFSTIRRSPRLPDSSSADLLFFYPCTSSTFYKLDWGNFKSLTLLLNLLLSFEVMLNSSEILWSFWKPFKRWLHISWISICNLMICFWQFSFFSDSVCWTQESASWTLLIVKNILPATNRRPHVGRLPKKSRNLSWKDHHQKWYVIIWDFFALYWLFYLWSSDYDW